MATDKCGGAATPRWFGYALQSLVYLAHHADRDDRCPSGEIAGGCATEATLMRRILSRLARAQIVGVREGREGGYFLLRPPESITLGEVYRALEIAEPLHSGMLDSADDCTALGSGMKEAFGDVIRETERKMMEVLDGRTIADMIGQVFGQKV